MEFVKHALGLCGEPHPNIFTMLLSTPLIGLIIYKVKRVCRITSQK